MVGLGRRLCICISPEPSLRKAQIPKRTPGIDCEVLLVGSVSKAGHGEATKLDSSMGRKRGLLEI